MQIIIEYVLHLDVHLKELVNDYSTWTYAILFFVIFCETGLVITPFLPGDSLLFAAGAITVESTDINVHILVLLLISAAILGDSCNYFIGKFFGERLFKNPNSKIFKQAYLIKTHDFYEKHGGKTIILARFVPIIRTFAPFVAGMGKMTYKKFISYCIGAAILWVCLFVYCGYLFGNMEFVKNHFSLLIIAVIIISLVPAIVETLKQKNKKAKQ
ncbi:MAG: DedA family protein [Bacteroidales bacterium]|nr:DedA family protein [Bacteroidales bacterium]